MSGRKKVLSEKLKRYNVILLVLLGILIVGLTIMLGVKLFYNDSYYRTVSRKENIKKSQKLDTNDYSTIGWIRVQGTNIDYPLYGVVQDTFKYPVTESYLWSLNMDKDYHNVMITYGHNIMNLGANPSRKDETFTRMEELMSYVYYDFADYAGSEVPHFIVVDGNGRKHTRTNTVKKDKDGYYWIIGPYATFIKAVTVPVKHSGNKWYFKSDKYNSQNQRIQNDWIECFNEDRPDAPKDSNDCKVIIARAQGNYEVIPNDMYSINFDWLS